MQRSSPDAVSPAKASEAAPDAMEAAGENDAGAPKRQKVTVP